MAAATRVIAAQGLSAPTATIAKAAGISNGSLFTYFDTKAELLNHLYVELKAEMVAAALEGLPTKADIHEQTRHMWTRWLRWTTACPEKRRGLVQLGGSGDLPPESLEEGHRIMAGIAKLLDESRRNGPMRDAPLGLIANMMSAFADATTDFMLRDPVHAEAHAATAYDALRRMIA